MQKRVKQDEIVKEVTQTKEIQDRPKKKETTERLRKDKFLAPSRIQATGTFDQVNEAINNAIPKTYENKHSFFI